MRTLLYTILIVTGSCMVPLTSLAQTVTRWAGTITGGAATGQSWHCLSSRPFL